MGAHRKRSTRASDGSIRHLLLGMAALGATLLASTTGCFAPVTPTFGANTSGHKAGPAPTRPEDTIQLHVECDWQRMPANHEIGKVRYMIIFPFPIFIGGTKYFAAPSYAAEEYRLMLREELAALGVTVPDDRTALANERVTITLVHAQYSRGLVWCLFFPIWTSSPGGVSLAAQIRYEAPDGVYERRVLVADGANAPGEVSTRIAKTWRDHARRVALAVVERRREAA